jgi:ABC-type nickel/cobalt efflux system permease component RcnA
MGIRPCAGAIVVLIYAHLVGAFEYGVLATLMMGLGTGLSIAGIALGTQLAKTWFVNLAQSGFFQPPIHTGNWLRMGGGVIIFLLGFSLFYATTQTISTHPLI